MRPRTSDSVRGRGLLVCRGWSRCAVVGSAVRVTVVLDGWWGAGLVEAPASGL